MEIAERRLKMNEQTYEQEISLQRVFYRVLRDWRKCFIIALVVAIVVGAGNFALKEIQLSTPEKLESAKMDYNRELTAYEAEGESLKREIENLEEMRTQQETYNDASILMQINPFREFNATVQLYVATDYKILTERTYQDIDLSGRILQSYLTYMQNGEMYQYILDHLTEKIEMRYLQEIFSISSNYDTRMVTMRVRNVDEKSSQEILNYALEGIYSKREEILTAIGDHELNSLNQSVYETVNLDLDAWQKSNRQYVSDLSVSTKEKLDDLTEWRLSPKPEKEYELSAIAKDSIKKMILGFVIVAILVAAFIAFRSILSDKVQAAQDLKGRFGLRMIAQIPRTRKKRTWRWIDQGFAKLGGLAIRESDAEQLIALAAQSINAELAAQTKEKADAETTNQKSIQLAFTGSIAEEEIINLLSGMNWGTGVSASSVPNILQNPASVSAVMQADYIVLVEKQEESSYSQIERELEELKAWKKEVLGVIVLGVDGIPA